MESSDQKFARLFARRLVHRMKFTAVSVDSPYEWRRALEAAPYQVFHLPEVVKALHGKARTDIRLLHGKAEGAAFNLPLVVREFRGARDVATPYGYGGLTGSGLETRCLDPLKEYLRAEGFICAYISVSPFSDTAAALENEVVYSNSPTVFLDLTQGIEKIERQMSSMRRRHIRLGSGVMIHRSKSSSHREAFVRHHRETMIRSGAAAFYRFPEETLRALVDMPEMELFTLEKDGTPRSSALFGVTQTTADYVLGGSDDQGRSFSSAVLWAAARFYYETGVPFVNLGGGMKEGDSLEAFKLTFGGARRSFKSLKWVLNRAAYGELCAAARVSPEVGAGFFPAYHDFPDAADRIAVEAN